MQGQNEEMLHAACQQFLGKSEAEIRKIALETLVSISFFMSRTLFHEQLLRTLRLKILSFQDHSI